MSKKTRAILFRVSQELMNEIEKKAKEQNRSIANFCECIIIKGLK